MRQRLNRSDASVCNSDPELVSAFDQACVSRVLPVPAAHRLFEGDHPSYTTASQTFFIILSTYCCNIFKFQGQLVGNRKHLLWEQMHVSVFQTFLFWFVLTGMDVVVEQMTAVDGNALCMACFLCACTLTQMCPTFKETAS